MTAPYKCSCGASFENFKAVVQHIKDKHKNNRKQFGIYKKVGQMTAYEANDILSEKDMR